MLDNHLTPEDFFHFIERGLEGNTSGTLERHLTTCPECLRTLDGFLARLSPLIADSAANSTI